MEKKDPPLCWNGPFGRGGAEPGKLRQPGQSEARDRSVTILTCPEPTAKPVPWRGQLLCGVRSESLGGSKRTGGAWRGKARCLKVWYRCVLRDCRAPVAMCLTSRRGGRSERVFVLDASVIVLLCCVGNRCLCVPVKSALVRRRRRREEGPNTLGRFWVIGCVLKGEP